MKDKITEIDMDKYHVMKKDDIEKFLTEEQKTQLSLINTSIRFGRIKEGKMEWPEHLILNMDDKIDLEYLKECLDNFIKLRFIRRGYNCDMYSKPLIHPKIKDIAVDLVNAILKAKK